MRPLLEGVSKSFGGRPALDRVSLALAGGGITCLLGPSGCGKSTLLRVAAGLVPADSGRVLVQAGQSAMVFQDPRLLPWLSVAENLALALPGGGKEEKIGRIREALGQVRLEDVEALMPRELSGGMAQRVGLARALLRQPEFLLMDEPFASLDAITRGDLQKMLARLIAARRITCLFVTHDISEALLLADYLYVLRDGKIQFEAALKGEGDRGSVERQILAYLQA